MKCEDRHFPSEADEIVIVPICRFAPLLRVELIPELSVDVCKKAAHVLFPPLTVCIERCHSFIEEKQISKEKVEERNCFKTNTIICMKMCFVTIFWSCLKPTGIKKIDHTTLQYLLMCGKCQHHSWEGDLWQKKCYSCFLLLLLLLLFGNDSPQANQIPFSFMLARQKDKLVVTFHAEVCQADSSFSLISLCICLSSRIWEYTKWGRWGLLDA